MGHTRLGVIPKTQRWGQVLRIIDSTSLDLPVLARAIVAAARSAYLEAARDPAISESTRILAVLASASRSDSFEDVLRQEGFDFSRETDAVRFLRDVFVHADARFGRNSERTIFTDFASSALRESLTETVSSQTGTLFTAGIDDVKDAYRQFSTERGFAQLSRLFFARLLAHSLQYFTDKRVASALGPDRQIHDEAAILELNRSIRSYSFEAAKVVEDFAGGWYSKARWRGSERETGGFASVAMEKIASELAAAE